jgi:hypothetical protein
MPDAEPQALREIVGEWHRRALPRINTKAFSESWSDFTIAWRNVKCPAGASLRSAMAAAEQEDLPPVLEHYDGGLRRLGALCWQLHLRWGECPFPLGCREAAGLLGISAIKAWRLFQTLQFDGLLRLRKKGSKASKRVSEWRFVDARNTKCLAKRKKGNGA